MKQLQYVSLSGNIRSERVVNLVKMMFSVPVGLVDEWKHPFSLYEW